MIILIPNNLLYNVLLKNNEQFLRLCYLYSQK